MRPRAQFIPSAAGSIDEALGQLTRVIDWSIDAESRIGYFAALYRRVTAGVAAGIRNGDFEDGERMERFDVIFANRYLRALAAHLEGNPTTQAWTHAFKATGERWPIVLQHLLLGINAHINLDLGIAAAETMRGRPLADLRVDFDRINQLLASMVDQVQSDLAEIWILMRVFNRFLGGVDDKLINFSMARARDQAWRTAGRFSTLEESAWPRAVAGQDGIATRIAHIVRRPGIVSGGVITIVRVGEVRRPSGVIGILTE